MKGLFVEVLRPASGYDCSINGITSKVNNILLIDEKLRGGLYEPAPDVIYLTLKRRNIFPGQPEYIHAVPTINGEKMTGGMFGGNFVTCSDTRIRELNAYPIPVHDRFEP
jgi:hypothetical protein